MRPLHSTKSPNPASASSETNLSFLQSTVLLDQALTTYIWLTNVSRPAGFWDRSIPWTNHEYSEWQCRMQRNFGLKLEPWFVMMGPVGLFPGHLHHTHGHHPNHHPVTFSWKETQITQNWVSVLNVGVKCCQSLSDKLKFIWNVLRTINSIVLVYSTALKAINN